MVEGRFEEIRLDLHPVDKAEKGDICSFVTHELVRRGDKVYRVIEVEEEF